MEDEQIYEEIKKRSKDGQISCKQCFEVAQSCNVNLKVVGSICNDEEDKDSFLPAWML